ncbi:MULTISPECIES: hypothetical protein [Bacillati]|uniref:hypothetical protein n=1 Tax=Bacillati TaxID=1783272 RepID=UPI002B24ECB2|nr:MULTISPECIES: hypothetical protein [Terrabacteria group]MEB2538382.1 hypothetical protein [Micrococcus luteus]MEB2597962.1 hypothetical protein [Corynebacterium amycolatum]MEB2616607.1 hypothetical protein [Bacillus cereus]MEB2620407.1 hypothetical protein [Kocuria rosea]MEB2657269.1 hypothetical protein [Staphylococcus haemolyticus]
MTKVIHLTGRMTTLNLSRFIDRQLRENESIRANIYETLRKRFNVNEADPKLLRNRAEDLSDTKAIHLLNAAQLLIKASEALTKANVETSGGPVTL